MNAGDSDSPARSPRQLSVDSLFCQSVARTPGRDALVDCDGGRRVSYAELDDRVDAIARGLQNRGIDPGDRVAVCLRNTPEHASLFLATQRAGAVAVPFNFRLAAEGVRYTVADADPELLVYGPAIRETVDDLGAELPCDQLVYAGRERATVPPRAEPFEALEADSEPAPVSVGLDDLSLIQYSSGTTGDPKGVMIDRLSTAARVYIDAFGNRFRMGDCMLGAMPLYHTVGLHGILLTMLATSGTYVSMPVFDPEAAVQAIEGEGVTAMHEAPTIFRELVETDAIDGADVSSVRAVSYSGAPMAADLVDRVCDAFDPAYISNQYGCTEAYAPLSQIDLLDGADPVETGAAHLFYRARIVEIGSGDPEAVVEQGEEGELVFGAESPVAFSGYWNKPGAEAAAIHDGWFFTGDVAYRPEPGRTIITGRADDMIISGGENIYPAEVEDVLAGHPAVTDVGVVGAPDDDWGERVVAYVDADGSVAPDALDAWCLDSADLPDFKRPREYVFVDALPRNPSGKIQRYQLRNEHEG
jgi:2-furoate---CoA ligase